MMFEVESLGVGKVDGGAGPPSYVEKGCGIELPVFLLTETDDVLKGVVEDGMSKLTTIRPELSRVVDPMRLRRLKNVET